MRGFAKKNVKRDQDLVATLGFFDIDTDKKKKGPIDPVFSQPCTQPKEEEEKESKKKSHPAFLKTRDEIEAGFNDDDRERVNEIYQSEIGFARII